MLLACTASRPIPSPRLTPPPPHCLLACTALRPIPSEPPWLDALQVCIDLLNVHLFHDDSNLVALQRAGGEARSVYATRRSNALSHCLREAAAAGASPAEAPLLFVFGDFNFRLDLAGVVEHVSGPEGLVRARGHAASEGTLQLSAASEDAGAAEGGGVGLLRLGAKEFVLERPWSFYGDHDAARSFDRELELLNASTAMPLLELPVKFKPSYMYHPAAAGASKKETAETQQPPQDVDRAFLRFGRKRCPSWCDRILMNASALSAVQRSAEAPMCVPVHMRACQLECRQHAISMQPACNRMQFSIPRSRISLLICTLRPRMAHHRLASTLIPAPHCANSICCPFVDPSFRPRTHLTPLSSAPPARTAMTRLSKRPSSATTIRS